MNNEMIVRIKVISKPQTYWTTTNPVIPVGSAAHVIGSSSSTVRVGNGKLKYSELQDTHIDSYVPAHADIHAASGRDPLIATDAELVAGTTTGKAPSVKQLSTVTADIGGKLTTCTNTLVSHTEELATIQTKLDQMPTTTVSVGAPSGGKAGDIWFQYIP